MEQLAEIFKALSNKHRLIIFKELLHREGLMMPKDNISCCGHHDRHCCIGELGKKVELAPSTISHHIKELKNAGLININRKGNYVYCSVNIKTWEKVQDFIR